MEVLAECSKLQLCPCYKKCQEFQKLVELKDYGLVIYCHRKCTENIGKGEAIESAVNTSSDVFILHNKKDKKVSTSQLTTELEKENISCPRCRKRFQHAQELMKEVKSLDRRIVMGICDHCRKKALLSKKPFCACEKIVKLFKAVKGGQTEDTKRKEIRASLDLRINRERNSPAAGHEPELQQMFYTDTHFQSDDTEISETDSTEGYIKQTVDFIEPAKSLETSFVHTPHNGEKIITTIPGISLEDSVTTFVESYVGVKELLRPSPKDRKQKEIFEEIPSINAKEELKRRHDLSLRQMVKLEKDSGVPISISKRPDVYETPKIAPWEQKQPTPKYHVESETDIKKMPTRTKHKLGPSDLNYVSFGSPRKNKILQDSDIEPSKLDKKQHDKIKKGLLGSEEPAKNVKNLEDHFSVTNLKLGRNVGKVEKREQGVTKSKIKPMASVGSVVKPQFSYFFPKVKEKKGKHMTVRSSEIIKDTHEKYKQRKEQKRQQSQGPGLKKQLEKKVSAEKKTAKSIKNKLKSSDSIKMSTSNIDKSISEEDEIKKVSINKKKEGKISTKKESPNVRIEKEEFKILQAEHLKAKAEALKKKLLLDAQEVKQEAEHKELKMINKRIIQARSNNFLNLVKIKQTTKITPFDINNEMLKTHTTHNKRGKKLSTCPLCLDSDLEIEVLSMNNERNVKKDKVKNIIIGEKIYRHKPGLNKTKKPEGVVPIFFQKDLCLESDFQEKVQIIPQEAEAVQKKICEKKDFSKKVEVDTEAATGIIRYALSDRAFIDKGWTVLPTEKVVRMMNIYRMRPSHPEFDWFEHNKNKRLMTYDTGERLAEFDDNGRGRWYYRSGRLALDYYDTEDTNAQQRFVIYSSGEPDERGRTHPITILATFDYLGNGIVFDHAGKIRLKYNQTEGVVLDRAIGPVSHWKWHTLNDPPVLQQVMIDTQLPHKDPEIFKLGSPVDVISRPDNEEMLAIEFDNFIKEKSKKLSQKLVPFQIKMKALKINEHFSLKVLDQATVYLIFRDGSTNLKVNMGMILDEKEIVDTDTAEVGEVSNSLERFPARTDSLAGLQRSLDHARRYERQHAERERRLRPPQPCASADLLTTAASMPMRLPLRTVPTGSSSTTRYCSRKPPNHLYYNTRLLC